MDIFTHTPAVPPVGAGCNFYTQCRPCLRFPNCLFLILITGEGICVKADETINHINIITTQLSSEKECDGVEYKNIRLSQPQKEQVGDVINGHQNPVYVTRMSPMLLEPNVNTTFTVHVKMDVVEYLVNEAKSEFHLYGRIHFEWIDSTLPPPWERTQLKEYLWWPVFTVRNDANAKNKKPFGEAVVIPFNYTVHIGDIPANFTSHCALDLLFWPFDFQTCQVAVVVESGRAGYKVKVKLWSHTTKFEEKDISFIALNEKTNGSQWDLVDSGASTDSNYCKGCKKPNIVYWLKLRRNSDPRLGTAPLILFVVTIVNAITAFQPHYKRFKMFSITFCSAIIQSMLFALYGILPPSGVETPVLFQLYLRCSVYLVITMILTALVRILPEAQEFAPLPQFVRRFVFHPYFLFGLRLRFVPNVRTDAPGPAAVAEEPNNDGPNQEEPVTNNNANSDWVNFLVVFDRIVFYIYAYSFFSIVLTRYKL